MKLAIFCGLISLLILKAEAAMREIPRTTGKVESGITLTKENLTKEVELYFKKEKPGVETWNITHGYNYHREPPVTATVKNFKYKNDCRWSKNFDYNYCKSIHVWYLIKGIVTPFKLFVNVSLPLFGNKEEIFWFDLNNATSAYWNPDNVSYPPDYKSVSFKEECKFSVKVHFQGYITYTRKGLPRGDESEQDTVSVEKLEDKDIGFHKIGRNKLSYDVKGTYRHLVVCPPHQRSR
uniref:Putative da-p36 protein n=1 Tax=Rhipicephalus pulchellus TaxID=72859 RepID=L7LTG0_RHIPC